MSADPKAEGEITFEAALKELESIATRLERGELTLEDAMAQFERGAMLARIGHEKLAEADSKVEQLVVEDGGRVSFRPFEPGAK